MNEQPEPGLGAIARPAGCEGGAGGGVPVNNRLITGLRSKRLPFFQKVLLLGSVAPANPPHPPEEVRDGHIPPAVPEIQVQPVCRRPSKLVSLELQLLLYAARFEPVVAEDDLVGVERAFEKVAERGEQPELRGTGRTRPIESSWRLHVIHEGSFHKPNPAVLGRNRGGSFTRKRITYRWALTEAG